MSKIYKNIFCISFIVLFISCIREQEKSSITTACTTLKSSEDVINTKEKDAVFQENLSYLRAMGYDEDNDSYIDVSAVNKAATLFKVMNMRMSLYPTLEEIKKELSTIQESYSMDINDIWRSVFIQRIKFHLSNPITYYEWKPTSECNPLRVLVSPDNKYKFYTTEDLCEGSASERVTYYQFLDSIGHLVCKEWQGNVMDVWQFNHNDTTFYVLKSEWIGGMSDVGWGMEIVSFANGIPTYHTHFFPDKNENTTKIGKRIRIRYDYTFHPQTLTITTQRDIDKNRKMEKWKLKI